MIPTLPSKPSSSGWITRIDSAWLLKLWRCVEYAMTHPRGDGKTILTQSGGTLYAITTTAAATAPGGGDASYRGYFAVVDDSNEEERAVSVVWGASPESNNLCLLNGKHALVPATRVVLPTTDSYLILIKWAVATDIITIVAETTLTEPSTSLVYYPLAQVVGGTINQLHYGIPSLIVTGGGC